MNEKTSWSKLFSVIIGILYITFGFLLIQNPTTVLKTLSLTIGWGTLIVGLIMLYSSYKNREELGNSALNVEAIIVVMLGLIFIFGDRINNTLILSYLLLFWIVMDSLMQLQVLFKLEKKFWILFAITLDIVVILISFTIIFQPSVAENLLVYYLAMGFMVTGSSKIIKQM